MSPHVGLNDLKTTIYKKQLFETLKNRGCTLNPCRRCDQQQCSFGKESEITKDFDFRALVTGYSKKEKECLTAEKNPEGYVFPKQFRETFKYFSGFSSRRLIRLKLDKVIDVFYSTTIPPIIKSKRNVIVVIENDNLNRLGRRNIVCPDCLKKENYQELKKKIAANLKETIVLIRKKLLKRLSKIKESFSERPQPGFLIMNDIFAPFPEIETSPIPVCSFAEEEPQMKPKCKNNSPRVDDRKKNSSTSEELYLQFGEKTFIKPDVTKTSTDHKKSTPKLSPTHDSTCPPAKNCSKSHPKEDSQGKKNDSVPKVNYSKNCIEVMVNRPEKGNKEGLLKGRNKQTTPENNSNHDKKNPRHNIFKELNIPQNPISPEGFSLSTVDASQSTVSIIPIFKPKDKGKRNIIIKLQNVPEYVDVIKVRSILSRIAKAGPIKNYSFLKNRLKQHSGVEQSDVKKSVSNQNGSTSNCMTCPNRKSRPSANIFFSSPYVGGPNVYRDRNPALRSCDRIKKNSNLRCYKKNDFFYDD